MGRMKIAMHWRILAALLAGAAAGWISHRWGGGADVAVYGFVGDLFMRALKMIIIPLIFASVVTGIAGLGRVEGFGRLGGKTLAYYALTSFLAIVIGLTVVNLVEPGLVDGKPNPTIVEAIEANRDAYAEEADRKASAAGEGLGVVADILRRMIPTNIFEAFTDNGAMLAVIFVALLTAFGIIFMKGEGREHLLGFFNGLNSLMIFLTGWVMVFAPVGVFGLVAQTVATTGFEVFRALPKFFGAVLLALLLHLLVVLPLVLRFVAGVNPWRHFAAMRDALLMAFSTASSSASLPVTMRCVQENAGVSRRVTSFVLPLGATVNMDGTALYECVAVLFVAQVLGQQLDLAAQISVVVLALLTSVGVAGVPSASLVAIVIILNNVGIEGASAAVGLILAVDRPLDMMRTAVNIFSDSCGAVVIARTEGEGHVLTGPRPGAASGG